jgi:hypothetical protein
VAPDRCLIIGDRNDRDGEAARRGGFPLLLKTGPTSPKKAGYFSAYAQLVEEFAQAADTGSAGRAKLDQADRAER